jgi:nitrite reductase/ring-hydroxylating ferredoxin subunit
MKSEGAHDCDGCPVMERRAFLKDAAMMAAGVLTALGIPAAVAGALPVRSIAALAARGDERAYAIPSTDGVEIDKAEAVIIARVQNSVYAFSLACPHQNTVLRWNATDKRFQCPKHKSKFTAEGALIDGKATRDMDRFALRREGDRVLVALDKLYRKDRDAAGWQAAVVNLSVG